MAAWTVMDPAKEARAVLDAMAKSLLDGPSMPTPAPLQTPPADALRALMSGNTAGQTVGKGNSSEVYACQSNPRVVTRTVRQQDEVEWQRELSRLRRVPALSVITTIFATSGRSALMPRLWPIPRGAFRTTEVIRLKYDISAALEMLHRAHISMDPMLQQSVSVALLLVAFAFGPSCSNFGSNRWESGPGLPEDQLDQIFGSGPVSQIQTARERRNFGEGISSRSVHGSSRHADLRHEEVWLTFKN